LLILLATVSINFAAKRGVVFEIDGLHLRPVAGLTLGQRLFIRFGFWWAIVKSRGLARLVAFIAFASFAIISNATPAANSESFEPLNPARCEWLTHWERKDRTVAIAYIAGIRASYQFEEILRLDDLYRNEIPRGTVMTLPWIQAIGRVSLDEVLKDGTRTCAQDNFGPKTPTAYNARLLIESMAEAQEKKPR